MWQAEAWALRALALLFLGSSVGWGSESPDRECCEPLYPFIPPPPPSTTSRTLTVTKTTTTTTFEQGGGRTTKRPYVDVTIEQQEIATKGRPGFVTPGPSNAALSCIIARQLCAEDPACAQILEIIPKVCGLELVACSTVTVTKCQAALRTLQGFPFFSPTCLCKEPHLDPECNQIREFLFDHPCGVVKSKESDPYPIDALPTCSHALNVCQQDRDCMQLYENFQRACRVQNGHCRMESWRSCQSAWSELRLSPMFGCICPGNFQSNKETCDRVFKTVNGNPCIDARFFAFSSTYYSDKRQAAARFWHFWYNQTLYSNRPGQKLDDYDNNKYGFAEVTPTVGVNYRTDSQLSVEESVATPVYVQTSYGPRGDDDGKVELRSTCHLALDTCERDASCTRFLDQVKKMCDPITCDRQKCMRAIQDFYRNIPEAHSLDVAFCLCKNTPSPDEQCLRAQSLLHPVCAQQPSGSGFDGGGAAKQIACHTIARSCSNEADCRRRLERYDQACSVDGSTKTCAGPPDACRRGMVNILGTELRTNCGCDGTAADFRELYDCIGWHRVLWVNPCVVEAQKDYHRIRGNFKPTPGIGGNPGSGTSGYGGGSSIGGYGYGSTPTQSPPTRPINNHLDPNRWPTSPKAHVTQYPPTPMMPTSPPMYPTPPWPKRRTTRRTTTVVTTTTTTTTTLPPKFCLLERAGQPVKYIREGYKKRLYKPDDQECSELCECNLGKQLSCEVIGCIQRDACNTGVAFYSHASPFYQAYRGQCLCYSGSFVCSKPPKDVEFAMTQGVYLFLGYSKKDEALLKKVTNQGALEAIMAIQGLVSYHNVNSNKSECRILLQKHANENLVLQAVMDEFEESREKGNLTAEILNREKDECYEALVSISRKINTNDADMRSHVVLSMIKVAAAEADVPDLPPSRGVHCGLHMANSHFVVFNLLVILILTSLSSSSSSLSQLLSLHKASSHL